MTIDIIQQQRQMIGKRKLITSPQPTRKIEREESSPSKANVLIQAERSDYIDHLKSRKENFATSLQLYQACYENELPQKCLKHLNFITLYCENERKLLCVNCLYGSTVHKDHKVIPSNSAQPLIISDNKESVKLLEEDFETIREAESRINENKKILEKEKQTIMREIDNEFASIYKMLEMKHREAKERANLEFTKAVEENEFSQRELGWWKNQIQYARSHFPRDSKGEQAELYKHLVLELMLQEKLQTDKLTYLISREQMQQQFLSQTRQLKQAVKVRTEKMADRGESRRVKLF